MENTKINQKTSNDTVNIALDTIGIGKQALVFVNTKRSAEKCAEDISKKVPKDMILLDDLAEEILKALSKPTRQCERLARCVRKGTAFHHAGLTYKQREIIEDNFRAGKIKIICSTPTLAAGLDMPAFRAIIRDLKRYTTTGWGGMQYIPVLEYLQMAGRAGRPKYDKYGESICIAQNETEIENIKEKYIWGEAEEIYSKLAVEPVLRTYLLSLVSTGFVHTRQEILKFFSKTFWAHQFKDMDKLEVIIDKMLELLERYEFIIMKPKDDFVSANEIEDDTPVRATLLGRRVSQLYIDPLTAHKIIKRIRMSAEKPKSSFSILQMVTNTLEMRPLLRVKTKEYDKINESLLEFGEDLYEKEPSIYEPEYDDFLASIKTALFMNEWIQEKDEEYLFSEFDIRPGETRMKIERANWLLYGACELAKLMSFHDIVKDIQKVRFRLKYGVREELLPLLKLKGIGRVRARKLFNNGIKDIGKVKNADVAVLTQLIGTKLGNDLKRQVGEEVIDIPVSERKRKGQMGLARYG